MRQDRFIAVLFRHGAGGSTSGAAWVNHIAVKTKGWESERFVQRVRIGLTGLAFVFILVLLGAVFSRSPTNESPITGNLIERQLRAGNHAASSEPGAGNEALPQEPLAQLGVAPGNADQNGAAPAAGGAPGQTR
ncbi:MAG: hypothetical protein JWO81_1040 [Alphaproteobacteria bacterium]|nr:hypothetical protein [Alphaproteobacteria bacterium]